MKLFDGHLDIGMNALHYERDQRLTVEAIREREKSLTGSEPGTCTITAESMRQADVVACVSTVIARMRPNLAPERPASRYSLDHPTQEMAHASASGQLAYYEALEKQGYLSLICDGNTLGKHWEAASLAPTPTNKKLPLGVIVTMEGADPIVEPDDIHDWHRRGLRSLMLAHFQQSCYAYGTPSSDQTDSGPLTAKGVSLLKEMEALGMPLDMTHLCDESFFQACDQFAGPIYASHSNCRVFADHQRQLSDEQIKIIHARDGVVGAVMYKHMIRRHERSATNEKAVTLSDFADHIDHICELVGDAKHVAIGSDLDGGFGRDDCPREIDTVADLHQLEPLLQNRGYSAEAIRGIMGENWLRFWQRNLPAS